MIEKTNTAASIEEMPRNRSADCELTAVGIEKLGMLMPQL